MYNSFCGQICSFTILYDEWIEVQNCFRSFEHNYKTVIFHGLIRVFHNDTTIWRYVSEDVLYIGTIILTNKNSTKCCQKAARLSCVSLSHYEKLWTARLQSQDLSSIEISKNKLWMNKQLTNDTIPMVMYVPLLFISLSMLLYYFYFLKFFCEAAIFGEPHLTTWDNRSISFHGYGEYQLTAPRRSSNGLSIQGRLEEIFLGCKS